MTPSSDAGPGRSVTGLPPKEAVTVHVLYMDIVDSTRATTDQQDHINQRLKELVMSTREFQEARALGELISLPTGDGMALVFLRRLEAPLRCAIEIARALQSDPLCGLRMGIHSGPVYVEADINGQPNVSGDGIALAARVMNCGTRNHILLTGNAADLLRNLGPWKNKLRRIGEYQVKKDRVTVWSFVDGEVGSTARLKAASRNSSLWRRGLGGGAIAAALALAAGWYLRSAPLLEEQDSIVLADFTNTTGDAVFDGTLRQALSLKLAESPYFNVLSDQKMARTLRLMSRQPDEPVTPQIAWEICARNGLKAVVSGSIAQLGNGYVLQLEATNCANGEPLTRTGAQIPIKDQVLPLLGQAAVTLRGKLGESLSSIQKFDRPFEATSTSLQALQLYTMARKARSQGKLADELTLLQHSIELDPNFAYGHAALSAEYANLRQADKASQYGRKAFELRDRVTEREKYYMLDKYYGTVTGQLPERIQSAKLWSLTYPGDYLAFASLGAALSTVGRHTESLAATLEALRLEPEGVAPYVNAMGEKAALGQFDDAKRMYDEAKKSKVSYRHIPVYYYDIAFLRHDEAGMKQAIEEALTKESGDHEILVEQAGVAAFYGRLAATRAYLEKAIGIAQRSDDRVTMAHVRAMLGHIEALFGLNRQARDHAAAALKLGSDRDTLSLAGWTLALAGDIAGAEKIEQDLIRTSPLGTLVNRVYAPALRAGITISRGQPAQAIQELKAALPYELGSAWGTLGMYPVYVRGEAYLQANDAAASAGEFQKILDHPGIVMNSPISSLARLGLARAHAASGNRAKARRSYQEFLQLWSNADASLPILARARHEFAALN